MQYKPSVVHQNVKACSDDGVCVAWTKKGVWRPSKSHGFTTGGWWRWQLCRRTLSCHWSGTASCVCPSYSAICCPRRLRVRICSTCLSHWCHCWIGGEPRVGSKTCTQNNLWW